MRMRKTTLFSHVALDDVNVFEAAELDTIALLADTWDDNLDPEVSAQLVQARAQAYLSCTCTRFRLRLCLYLKVQQTLAHKYKQVALFFHWCFRSQVRNVFRFPGHSNWTFVLSKQVALCKDNTSKDPFSQCEATTIELTT